MFHPTPSGRTKKMAWTLARNYNGGVVELTRERCDDTGSGAYNVIA